MVALFDLCCTMTEKLNWLIWLTVFLNRKAEKGFFFLELLDWTTQLHKNISQGPTTHFSLEEVLSIFILHFFIKNVSLVIFAKLGSYFIFSYIYYIFHWLFLVILYSLGKYYIFSRLFHSSGQKKSGQLYLFLIFLVKNSIFQGFWQFQIFPQKNPLYYILEEEEFWADFEYSIFISFLFKKKDLFCFNPLLDTLGWAFCYMLIIVLCSTVFLLKRIILLFILFLRLK